MPRTVTPLGLRSRSMPQTFSLGECRLTMTMELGFMALCLVPSLSLPQRRWRDERDVIVGVTKKKPAIWSLDGHDSGAIGRKQQGWLGEGLDLVEGGVRCDFAEEQPLRSHVDEGEFGDDVVDDFDAGEG